MYAPYLDLPHKEGPGCHHAYDEARLPIQYTQPQKVQLKKLKPRPEDHLKKS